MAQLYLDLLEGRYKGQVGYYDLEVMLAERYHWTPEQIDELDEEYLVQLLARIRAQGQYEKRQSSKRERDAKKEARKKARAGAGGHPAGELADLDE